MQDDSLALYPFVIPLIQYTCDTSKVRQNEEDITDTMVNTQPRLDRIYLRLHKQETSDLLEDGLALWHAVVQAAPTRAPDELWALFTPACRMLEMQGDTVYREMTSIFQSYLLLEQRPALLVVHLAACLVQLASCKESH